jgi:hypothetical protein
MNTWLKMPACRGTYRASQIALLATESELLHAASSASEAGTPLPLSVTGTHVSARHCYSLTYVPHAPPISSSTICSRYNHGNRSTQAVRRVRATETKRTGTEFGRPERKTFKLIFKEECQYVV